jgi:hypothetical protein
LCRSSSSAAAAEQPMWQIELHTTANELRTNQNFHTRGLERLFLLQ